MGHQKKKKTQALKAAAASVKKRRDAQIKRGPRCAPDKPWNFEKLTRPATKRIEVDETALKQRNSPVKAKSDESGCAATNVNANEKTLKRIERLWSAVACVREARARSKTGKVKKEIMVTIAENHRLSASHLYWVVRRSQSWSLRRRAGSGRPRTATKPEKLEWLTHKNNETNGMLSLRELGAAMKAQNPNKHVGSKTAVQRAWKELGYRHVRVRTLPRLEDKHVHDRLAWATERAGAEQPFGDDETIHIHVDEKWFYVVRIGQLQWRGQHEHLRPIHIIHRSHVVKEMFLAAVARPIPSHGFAGNIGLWPVTKTKAAQRKSKHHNRGDEYEASTTMDTKKFKEMLCALVLPMALEAGRGWAKKIVLQMDNAGGHGGGNGNINGTTIPSLNSCIKQIEACICVGKCKFARDCIQNSASTFT